MYGATLDGVRRFQFPLGSYACYNQWQGDSRHWVEFCGEGEVKGFVSHALVHTIDPSGAAIVPFAQESPLQGSRGEFNINFMRLTQDERLLIPTGSSVNGITSLFTFYECDLRQGAKLRHEFNIHLPPTLQLQDIAFSPMGDRIALDLVQEYTLSLPAYIHWLLPSYSVKCSRIAFTNPKGLVGVGLPRSAAKRDPEVTLTWPDGRTERGKFGWKDIQERNLPDAATIERTVMDDTLPGGPHHKLQRWVAPFATADRESDYATAWGVLRR